MYSDTNLGSSRHGVTNVTDHEPSQVGGHVVTGQGHGLKNS